MDFGARGGKKQGVLAVYYHITSVTAHVLQLLQSFEQQKVLLRRSNFSSSCS